MNRIIIRTNTADVESGPLRAYIVQKQEYVKKPSTCIRRALARRRKARKASRIIVGIIKGAYAFTFLAAAIMQRYPSGCCDNAAVSYVQKSSYNRFV